jgi:hypothetical protein
VILLAPYPNNPNPMETFNVKTEFDLQGDSLVWYAHPQLFFNCTLWAMEDSHTHKEVSLMYFSTFEPIELTPDSVMQQAGVPIFYDSASNQRLPCLYTCPVANVLGRAQLSLCFIGGNSHPTIPHSFKDDQSLGSASADTQPNWGNSSRIYKVNIWMWLYGRGSPLMVSITEVERIRNECVSRAGSGQPRRGSITARVPQQRLQQATVEPDMIEPAVIL